MGSNKDTFLMNSYLTVETFKKNVNPGERLIRVVLMTGFIAVLAVETWLLLQALQIWL